MCKYDTNMWTYGGRECDGRATVHRARRMFPKLMCCSRNPIWHYTQDASWVNQ
jgi:hypothetical protein